MIAIRATENDQPRFICVEATAIPTRRVVDDEHTTKVYTRLSGKLDRTRTTQKPVSSVETLWV